MASIATFTCLCGARKQTSNHWILAQRTRHSIKFLPWDWALASQRQCRHPLRRGLRRRPPRRSLGDWKQASIAALTLNNAA